MYKIISKSTNGLLSLALDGEPAELAKWYAVTPKSKEFVERLKKGDLVEVTIEEGKGNNKSVITFIKKYSGGFTPGVKSTTPKSDELGGSLDGGDDISLPISKLPDSGGGSGYDPNYHKKEAERKNRQGTLGAVATIVASLGFTKNDNVQDIITMTTSIYDALISKFSGSFENSKQASTASQELKSELPAKEVKTSKKEEPVLLDADDLTEDLMSASNLDDDGLGGLEEIPAMGSGDEII